ncbi:MAG: PadR family transcriptional regulator [Paludibacteraceae bacterium]|jgi:PadR family transcriptional regulator PadR|nr:PadR family transcriptional regulator [Paludibacteraceae bacterium]
MLSNIKSQMRKGLLEYCILSIISRGEAYSSDILETLKRAQLVVVEGTVYPLLTRMKNEGLLSYRWQESTGGPPRKYYTLTVEGQTLLSQLSEEWQIICQAVNLVTNPDQQIANS